MSTPEQQNRSTLATIYDVAAALQVSPVTVRRMTKDGRLRSTKLGPSTNSPVRIPSTEVARLLREGLR